MNFASPRAPYPATRMRRLRAQEFSRRLVREHKISADDLIYPVFILDGESRREAVGSMPGVERLSIDQLIKDATLWHELGLPLWPSFLLRRLKSSHCWPKKPTTLTVWSSVPCEL